MNFANPAFSVRGATGMRFMLLATLAAGMLSMNAGRGTLAYFTTQVTSTGNTFTAGNLRFNIADALTSGQYPSLGSSLSLGNMKPSDVVIAPLQLNNVGNINARYGVKYSTSSALATQINGYTISAPSTTTFQELGRAASAHTDYGTLTNDYIVITGGAGAPAVNKINSNTADTLTVATAWTTNPDSTTQYLVAKYPGTSTGSTTTTVTDSGATWTPNQWANYSVTIAGTTAKIVSNTATALTVSPAFGSAPANGTYYINPTNLAPALQLAIVGKGTGTGTATTTGATACNAANFGTTSVWQDVNIQATPTLMSAAGATILDVTQPAGTGAGAPRALNAGANDVVCVQVKWPDGGAPPSLTTGDNAYNGATAGSYSTVLNFTFDGQ